MCYARWVEDFAKFQKPPPWRDMHTTTAGPDLRIRIEQKRGYQDRNLTKFVLDNGDLLLPLLLELSAKFRAADAPSMLAVGGVLGKTYPVAGARTEGGHRKQDASSMGAA